MKKNRVVLLYGMPASGKLTIASLLAREMGYTLIDNHYFHDFVRPFTEHRSDWPDDYYKSMEKLRKYFLEILAKFCPQDRVVKYVFTNMLLDDAMGMATFRDIEQFAKKIKAYFVPVELFCRRDVLNARVVDGDRAARGKISDVKKLKRVIEGRRILRVDHPNRLRLDTSDSTAEENLEKIRAHLGAIGAVSRAPAAVRKRVKVR
jgi:hypothetical protein